ncbi:hypothetical protein FRC15_001543 [Serendipita sp. 397]|nr:hypothetical protein FRC15_001543 [Serendipita sp. 397]
MAAARLAVLRALWSPTKIIPNHTVRDIRNIDFKALREAGYEGVVFDKDNCLTLPLKDEPIPSLLPTLRQLQSLFPRGHVLVVSNSAGSYSDDPEWLEAEGVERAFTTRDTMRKSNNHHPSALLTKADEPPLVHVLRHRWKKPSRKCAKEIWTYFEHLRSHAAPSSGEGDSIEPIPSTLPASPMPMIEPSPPSLPPRISSTHQPDPASSPSETTVISLNGQGYFPTRMSSNGKAFPSPRPRLIFVGDRLMTDVLLANEMGAYSIWTTHLWERDVMLLRSIEIGYLGLVRGTLWIWARDWKGLAKSIWYLLFSLSRSVRRGIIWTLNVRKPSIEGQKGSAQDVTSALAGLQAGSTVGAEPHPKSPETISSGANSVGQDNGHPRKQA